MAIFHCNFNVKPTQLEPSYLIIAFIIIFFASMIKGLTGFGLALVAMPLLSFFFPVKFLVPIITIINLLSSVMIIIKSPGSRFEKGEKLLPIFGVVGAIAGLLILPALSDILLKQILSVILVILAIAFLSGYRFKIHNIVRARITAGFTSGILGGLFSIAGPPMVLFLTSLDISNSRFRVTFSLYSVLVTFVALTGYLLSGLVTIKIIIIAGIMMPAVFTGIWLGGLLVEKIPVALFRRGCIWLTLISGVLIFVSAFSK